MKPRHLILTGTLAACLSLSGCKGKDAAPAKGKLLTSQTLKAQFKENIPDAKPVDNAKAEEAIAFLKAEGVNWERREGENGSYTFYNLNFAEDNATAGQLTVSGLQMLNDETPYASYISIKDIKSEEANIQEMTMTLPSKDTLQALESLDDNLDSSAALDIISSKFMSFSGGGYVEGLTFSGDGVENGQMDFLGWTKDKEKMSGLIEGTSFKAETQADDFANFQIGHISVTDIDLSGWDDGPAEASGFGALMSGYMALVNPYKRGYESFAIRDMKMSGVEDGANVSFELPRGDVWFTEDKGGVYHNKIEFPEIIVKVDESQASDFPKEAFEDFGLDEMVFKYWGDVRIDRNNDNLRLLTGGFGMKDMMEFDITYDVDGMSGYFNALNRIANDMGKTLEEASTTGGSTPDALGALSENMAEEVAAEMMKMTFNEMTLELRDKSLMEKAFKFVADEQGVSVGDLKENAKASLHLGAMGAQTKYQRTLVQEGISAGQNFIDSGGSIRISLKPQGGFSAQQAMEMTEQNFDDPEQEMEMLDDILKRLNIKVEHVPG